MTLTLSTRTARWLRDIARDRRFQESFVVGAVMGFALFAWLLIDY